MATNQSTVAKKLLSAVKSLNSLRDPSVVSTELSTLPSDEIYLLRGIADTALNQSKRREEEERETAKRKEEEKTEAAEHIFTAMRSLPLYNNKSDAELRSLIAEMNKQAQKPAAQKAKNRRARSKKLATSIDTSQVVETNSAEQDNSTEAHSESSHYQEFNNGQNY